MKLEILIALISGFHRTFFKSQSLLLSD